MGKMVTFIRGPKPGSGKPRLRRMMNRRIEVYIRSSPEGMKKEITTLK